MSDIQTALRVAAPAKLNLSLQVTARRFDGYHLLLMLNVPISLEDEIRLRLTEGTGVRSGCMQIEPAGMPPGFDKLSAELVRELSDPEKNLALRAASRFLDHFEIKRGVEVGLTKRIPLGAGLGGGSSDGAAVLRGLREIFLAELTARGVSRESILESLRAIALSLGADLPYFLDPQPSIVSGIGEEILALGSEGCELLQDLPLAVVLPEIPMFTPTVFAKFKELKLGFSSASVGTLQADLLKVEREDLSTLFIHNDLEPAILALEPRLGLLLGKLREISGAHISFSGSGSAIFVMPHSSAQSSAVFGQLERLLGGGALRACVIHCRVITP